nr:hypothetical protein [Rhodococcus sp. (in: high G+C Gram-positive bacteria)]
MSSNESTSITPAEAADRTATLIDDSYPAWKEQGLATVSRSQKG